MDTRTVMRARDLCGMTEHQWLSQRPKPVTEDARLQDFWRATHR
jgi:hypothetical protein